MHYAQGVLTVRGGMTSHAAVVARGMGTCCVSGCGAIKMNEEAKTFELSGKTYKEGDWISIDGSTGNIYGQVPQAAGPHQRRHPARRPAGCRLRRRGHRPVPYRAYVL